MPKPLVPLGGRPLVAHALAAARDSGLEPVLAVVSDPAVAAAAGAVGGVEVVWNRDPGAGISSSLRAALGALGPRGHVAAAVVGLGDQPLVGPAAYRRVAAAYDDGARLAVATYGGVRGNPVLVARDHWPEAMGLTGDEGARVLLRRHGAVEVPCDGTGEPTDVDTPADLAAVEARWRSPTASE
ncbi:MAG: cytidylyltransferase [Acidimicrobiia bacterium]|nr:MAG: cytidylyltransferase [Acidimicrobiia bacterium]